MEQEIVLTKGPRSQLFGLVHKRQADSERSSMELRVVADEVIQADMEIAYAQARVAAAQRDLEVAQARRQAALLELQQCGYTGEGLHELLETARRDNFLLQAAC